MRLSSGWARPVRVNAGVRLGPELRVLRVGERRGVPRRELLACGDLVWVEGEKLPVVVKAIKSRDTAACVRADGSAVEVGVRRIRQHRPRPGVVL